MYALFFDNKQISKAHSTKEAVAVEAYGLKAVIEYGADFIGDKAGRVLADRYEIREI